ncbi:MAG: FkbM family methyltransferase [Ruminococcaceae bacterium]|nr:FkbM family methyltransferase [Oscillospiraceae bacterium]
MKIPVNTDLWQQLSVSQKPIVLYGMGNGADKILAVCDRYGIPISDVFASDGFVRGHSFHGMPVLSYSAVKEKYGAEHLTVLLSFASARPEVLALFDLVDSECELYAPDVPVCGDTLFTYAFFESHRAELEAVYDLLADEESRRIYENVLAYKLTGKLCYLRQAESDKDTVYGSLLQAADIRTAADLGAYNGDTVRELMAYAPELRTVWAMEPDRRNFRKLSDFAGALTSPAVHACHAAAWSQETTLTFADSGNRNAGAFAKGKTVEVCARPLDAILDGQAVDYIKYDVEGAEKEALLGSRQTILTHHPKLLVSLYHRTEDLFALPLQIHAMNPDYRLYLRRYPYVPAWDLNLICM